MTDNNKYLYSINFSELLTIILNFVKYYLSPPSKKFLAMPLMEPVQYCTIDEYE